MRRSRITITLDKYILEKIDSLVDKEKIRNRSHAIEFVLSKQFEPTVRKAVILAGGKGTKLRPFTYEMPKSLLPIKNKPLLEHLINRLKNDDIRDIVVCTGYLGEKIKEYFGNGKRFGVNITYSDDKNSLQTGGALKKARSLIDNEPFLLVYGDIITDISFRELILFHEREKGLATVALTTVSHPSDFGQLKLSGTRLVGFYQKGTATSKKILPPIQSFLINCGMYVFESKIFNYFPEKKSFKLEDVIEHLVTQGKINGFVFEKNWFDVGNKKDYERAIKEFQNPSNRK